MAYFLIFPSYFSNLFSFISCRCGRGAQRFGLRLRRSTPAATDGLFRRYEADRKWPGHVVPSPFSLSHLPLLFQTAAEESPAQPLQPGHGEAPEVAALIALPGGEFTMGSDEGFFPEDGEGPTRRVRVSPFLIGAHEVSNARFAAFVAATGYKTEAERFGNSFVLEQFISPAVAEKITTAVVRWWRGQRAEALRLTTRHLPGRRALVAAC